MLLNCYQSVTVTPFSNNRLETLLLLLTQNKGIMTTQIFLNGITLEQLAEAIKPLLQQPTIAEPQLPKKRTSYVMRFVVYYHLIKQLYTNTPEAVN